MPLARYKKNTCDTPNSKSMASKLSWQVPASENGIRLALIATKISPPGSLIKMKFLHLGLHVRVSEGVKILTNPKEKTTKASLASQAKASTISAAATLASRAM